TLLGNTINIAGKNRFLALNVLYEILDYLNNQSQTSNFNTDTAQIKAAEQQLDSNIIVLKEGGKISGLDIQSLSPNFLDSWNTVNKNWQDFKTVLTDKLYNNAVSQKQSDLDNNLNYSVEKQLAPAAFGVINSSDALVTKLGQQVKSNQDNLVLLQIIFGMLIILLILFILFLVRHLLKPISSLTKATSEIQKGNFDISVKYYGKDELATLVKSFNSMVTTIRNDTKRQTELTDQLKQLNEQLRYEDKAKDEFVSMISHELRNPLVPIKCFSDILLDPKSLGGLNEEQKGAVKCIQRNEVKLESLLKDILDLYKFNMAKIRLSKKEVPISNLITNVTNDLNPILEEKGVSMVTEVNTKTSSTVICDDRRIEQVLSNLIKNSVDFVPSKEGRILLKVEELEAKKEGSKAVDIVKKYLLFSVKDNGGGIPEDKIDNLFEKFYKVDAITPRKYGGTGLGLAICKEIIEAHEGKILAHNNSDGKGATFSFTLPLPVHK
ncbi:MAG TPA: ATP-binding protein, partial [Nitrososphaeraceae archaeon]|nr:ATP-binding protein [Nitrososphaeraceae archaeon]